MLKWIKKIAVISLVSFSCTFASCDMTSSHHEGSSKEWIIEQVEKGYLTQEEANELMIQEGLL